MADRFCSLNLALRHYMTGNPMALNTPDKPLAAARTSTEQSEHDKSVADQTAKEAGATIPAFTLPISNLLSERSKQALADYRQALMQQGEEITKALAGIPVNDYAQRRELEAQCFYQQPFYKALLERYPVTIEQRTIGGVLCEVFTPIVIEGSVPDDRVLLNFHGGSFQFGARTNSHLESIPIAALSGITVISADYRMSPEYHYPAATEDAVAVYDALLAEYSPTQLGVFGASAGASLSAMLIASLVSRHQPLPAAVGLFACGAIHWQEGDYHAIGAALLKGVLDYELAPKGQHPYFKGVACDDVQAFPGYSPEIMAAFPPTLCISSTRDFALSAVVHTHNQLVEQGVSAELHIWDGLDHVFHYNPYLPEAHAMHKRVAAFFKQRLA
jgi:monoterpene epsilon-lactone hydrolase